MLSFLQFYKIATTKPEKTYINKDAVRSYATKTVKTNN